MRSQFHRNRIRAVLESEFGHILFEDVQEEQEPIAEQPVRTGIGTTLSEAFRPSEMATSRTKKTEARPSIQRESEYIEDFEIEGGGAKKKRD